MDTIGFGSAPVLPRQWAIMIIRSNADSSCLKQFFLGAELITEDPAPDI